MGILSWFKRKQKKQMIRHQPCIVSNDEMVEALRMFGIKRNLRPRRYIKNEFEVLDKVVVDHVTDLMWQKSGSVRQLMYQEAQTYIEKLNREQYAGYDDWRLPTVNELMSLVERKRRNLSLLINPIFDQKQINCWSADMQSPGVGWDVCFGIGSVSSCYDNTDATSSVRAVRSV